MGFLKPKTGNSKEKTKTGTKTGTTTVTNGSNESKEAENPEKEEKKPQKVQKFQKFQKYFRSPITVIILSVLAVIVFAAAATAGILLFLKEDEINREIEEMKIRNRNKIHNEVCNTPDCLTLAYQLQNWRDPKTDPCDDFYQYSCGRFFEYSNGANPLADKGQNMVRLLKKFLTVPLDPKDTITEVTMKKFYTKCEKEKANGFVQAQKEAFAFMKKNANFPWTDENWKEGKLDVTHALILMAKYGVMNFGLFSMSFNETATSKGLKIIPPLRNSPILPDQFAIVEAFLQNNGVNIPSSNLQAEMQAASDLRDKLSSLSKFVSRSETESMNIYEISAAVQKCNFLDIFSRAYSEKNIFLPDPSFDVVATIGAPYVELFVGADKNIDTFMGSAASRRTILNLLFLQLMEKVLQDVTVTNECAKRVIEKMPRPALQHFVRNYFKKENRNAMSDLIEDVRNSFIEIFKKNSWMEESTRQSAIEKAEKMTKVIGYGDEYEPEWTLEKMYADFAGSIFNDDVSYFSAVVLHNHLTVHHWVAYMFTDSHFNILLPIYDVNAYYHVFTNTFNMLIPYQDEPFFDTSFPKFAQLAGIGRIIGHEIGHGFDSLGRKYDKNGEEIDWWTSGDARNYRRKEQCVVDQYSNYEDPDFGKIDGDKTKGENIADLISAQVLWNAYKTLDPSQQPKLSGFNDTDKLFFQIGALAWCEHRDNPTAIRDHILKDVHGVNKFRVNGVYQNMPEFSATFNCPKGSPMNPADKCEMFF